MTHHIDLATIHLDHGAKANEGDDRGCLLFEGYIESNGYGKTSGVWAHRRALAEKLGRPIAPGMDACHTCDVRACVNPAHLYEGTRTQNILNSVARGRWNRPRGEAHPRATLTDADVRAIRARAAAGMAHRAQARLLGIHPVTISRLVRRINRPEVSA